MAERALSMTGSYRNELISLAKSAGRKSTSVSADLAALLFPKSDVIFNDRMLSNIRQSMFNLISEIETELCRIATNGAGATNQALLEIGNAASGGSFDLLNDAGLLQDRDLLNFLFARTQEHELQAQMSRTRSPEQLDAALLEHLDHHEPMIAEAAMGLVVARSKAVINGQMYLTVAQLPAELTHKLAWKVVAAVEKLSGANPEHLAIAANEMLAEHDEGDSLQNKALRLAQLLAKESTEITPLEKSGLNLFLAQIALGSGLSVDQLVGFTSEPKMARFVVIMRGLEYSYNIASSSFAIFHGGDGVLTTAAYDDINIEEARALTKKWSMNTSYQSALDALGAAQREL